MSSLNFIKMRLRTLNLKKEKKIIFIMVMFIFLVSDLEELSKTPEKVNDIYQFVKAFRKLKEVSCLKLLLILIFITSVRDIRSSISKKKIEVLLQSYFFIKIKSKG